MIRRIAGFHQDEAGDWVAELSCLHDQHVRHHPPFQDRPWVLEPAGRQERIGSAIECPLCDRAELPAGVSLLRVAGPWDQDSLPAGLRRPHRTAAGVWGVVEVREGAVGLRIETTPSVDRRIGPGESQAIPPGAPHALTLDGPFRLVLQFWGRPPATDVTLRDGRVVSIFRTSGLPTRTRLADGVVHVAMELDPAGEDRPPAEVPAPGRGQTPSRGATSEE